MRREVVAERVAGGFVIIRAGQLMAAWNAYREDKITLADLRVYLACHEVVARRCGRQGPNFNLVEICTMTANRRPRAAIKRLVAAGLITLEGHRLEFLGPKDKMIPFPRRMLRRLARAGRPSLIATVFGHAIRCLAYDLPAVVSGGCCKASWLAKEFGIDPRNVKLARAELESLGWLEQELMPQWYLNLRGGWFVVDLGWGKSPPPAPGNCTISPPPDSEKEPVPGNENQEPSPGVSIQEIQIEDLKVTERTLELHAQAVAAGVVNDSEADRLKIVAAAEHAISTGKTNPCGLFFVIVMKRLFAHITQADEDRARKRFHEYRFGRPEPAHVPASRPTLTADQAAARRAKALALQIGWKADPFYLLRREDPAWTRPRWDAACE